MTRVCLVASDDVGADLGDELDAYPTASAALSTYDLRRPFANAVAVETISLGAAVSLLNDLDWYLTRLTRDAIVLEPSVSDTEYLSRHLARRIRDGHLDPEATGERLKLYGIVPGDETGPVEATSLAVGSDGAADEAVSAPEAATDEVEWLVEPLYVSRPEETVPSYDLRPVIDTLRVRITDDEFE